MVEGWGVVERRWELEHRGRDLLLLSFTSCLVVGLTRGSFVSSMVKLQLNRGRGVNTRKVDCERLQGAPWWLNS